MAKTLAATANENSLTMPSSMRLAVTAPGVRDAAIHVVDAPFVLVGRTRGCALRLDDPAVSRRHLYLQSLVGRVISVDLSAIDDNASNDRQPSAIWLKQNESITAGPYHIRVAEAGKPENGRERVPPAFNPLDRYEGQFGAMPKVKIDFYKGDTHQAVSTVTRLIMLGGSSAGCKLRLKDKSVSSIHFSLVLAHEGLYAVDLAGRSGIRINDNAALFEKLNDGDTVQVGKFLLRVNYTGETLGGGSSAFIASESTTTLKQDSIAPSDETVWPKPSMRVDDGHAAIESLHVPFDDTSDDAGEECEALDHSYFDILPPDSGSGEGPDVPTLHDEARSEQEYLSAIHKEIEAERTAIDVERLRLASARNQLVEISQLRAEIEAAHAGIAQLRAEVEEKSLQLRDEQSLVEQMRGKLDATATELTSKEAALQEGHRLLEDARGELQQKEENLRSEKETVKRQQDEVGAEEVRLAALENSMHAERQSLASLQTEFETLKAAVEDARRQNQVEDERLANLRTSLAQEREEFEFEKLEFEDVRRQLDSERDALRQGQANIANQRQELQSARASLEEQKKALESASSTLDKKREELNSLQVSFRAEQEQLDSQKTAFAADRDWLEVQRSLLDSDQDKLAKAEINLQARSQELEAAEDDLDVQRAALVQTRGEFEEERTAFDAKLVQLELERAQLQADREALQVEQDALVVRAQSLVALRADLDAEKAALETERQSLVATRRQLAEISLVRDKLKDQLRLLREQRQSLEAERTQFAADASVLVSQQVALQAAQERLEPATADLSRREAVLQATEVEVARQREALAAGRDNLQRDAEEATSRVETVRVSLEAERLALEAARAQLKAREASVLAQSKEVDIAKNSLDSVRIAIEQKHEELASEHAHLDRLRETIEKERAQLEADKFAFQATRNYSESVVEVPEEEDFSPPQIIEPSVDDAVPDRKTVESQRIQGTWALISVEANGYQLPQAAVRRQTFVWIINEGKITHQPEKGFKRESTFDLDVSVKPHQIIVTPLDGQSKGQAKRAIYSLDENLLKVCVYKDTDQIPDDFSTTSGNGLRILVFKRQAF